MTGNWANEANANKDFWLQLMWGLCITFGAKKNCYLVSDDNAK